MCDRPQNFKKNLKQAETSRRYEVTLLWNKRMPELKISKTYMSAVGFHCSSRVVHDQFINKTNDIATRLISGQSSYKARSVRSTRLGTINSIKINETRTLSQSGNVHYVNATSDMEAFTTAFEKSNGSLQLHYELISIPNYGDSRDSLI